MALPIYLAMMPWEFQGCGSLPERIGWMSCSFSSCNEGLTGLPAELPENSLLLLSDQIPPQGHDPTVAAQQLESIAQKLKLSGIILDFQRPHNEETAGIVRACNRLPCPTAVTPVYAENWNGAVFLPPVPVFQSVESYCKPWQGRDIWLEIENQGLELAVNSEGCNIQPLTYTLDNTVFQDDVLFCHYTVSVYSDRAVFALQRTPEDTHALLSAVQRFGVSRAVGLYQEFY